MYYITCLQHKPSETTNGGDLHTFGYFKSLQDAQHALAVNRYDMHETTYDYAVIERIPEGIHPDAQIIGWYQYNPQEKTFEPIAFFKQPDVNFAFG